MKILLYNSSARGMGHFSRSVKISNILTKYFDQYQIMVLVGNAFNLTEKYSNRIEFIKLPQVFKNESNQYESSNMDLDILWNIRKNMISQIINNYSPDIFMVDSFPRGVNGELIESLKFIKNNSKIKTILMFRDIIDCPKLVKIKWTENRIYDIFEKYYDYIIIFGNKHNYDFEFNYDLYNVSNKLHYLGYLAPGNCLIKNYNNERNSIDVLVTVGGGIDGKRVIETIIKYIIFFKIDYLNFTIVLGPNSRISTKDIMFNPLKENDNVTIIKYTNNMDLLYSNSKIVICMGGYNTITEVLHHNKKMIIIPRDNPTLEQKIRAEYFSSIYDCVWIINFNELVKLRYKYSPEYRIQEKFLYCKWRK